LRCKRLVICPCYNEESHLDEFLDRLLRYWYGTVLVVDDGSTDSSPIIISRYRQINTIRFAHNSGYGEALKVGFQYAIENGFDQVITIDSDGQHDPSFIASFFEALSNADMITGTRFSEFSVQETDIPCIRLEANKFFANLVNRFCSSSLTDSLCGFRAYQGSLLEKVRIRHSGYTMPLGLWPQLFRIKAKISELPISLRYIDSSRNFKGQYATLSDLFTDCVRVFFDSLQENGLTERISFESRREIVDHELEATRFCLLPRYIKCQRDSEGINAN